MGWFQASLGEPPRSLYALNAEHVRWISSRPGHIRAVDARGTKWILKSLHEHTTAESALAPPNAQEHP